MFVEFLRSTGVICKNKSLNTNTLIQMILKVKLQMKPEAFMLGQMDRQLENSHGTLFLYI